MANKKADEKTIFSQTKHIGNMTVKGDGEFAPKSGYRIAQEFIITTGDKKKYAVRVGRKNHVHTYDGDRAGEEIKNPPKEITDFMAAQQKNYDDFAKKHKLGK